ncbi:hypothetical protein G1H11_16470 [Phytoactinopolyspora alkaliphila]|uniref:Uncharacterized protein n=1 Tax=Phytoactinopolyspora alkaliphila TaxID=1783498 RepID=A0A6N9YPJ5_9ACTN|nr:hypothetical protein [Phytoactinopolyspora alkaliphila]NED96902.1 hypothetical protein [Phytoactinopolyspora alkaliphila]
MLKQPPSWPEMLGRMVAVGFSTARGVIRSREPSEPSGDEATEGRCRFWHAAPDLWRVDDGAGIMHLHDGAWNYVRDPDGTVQRVPSGSMLWGFDVPHPWSLFGTDADKVGRFTERDDFCVPIGAAEAVEIAGRLCWQFTLAPPPHKPHPLQVAVDDITGTVLRIAAPESGFYAVAEEFEPDVDIPPATFTYDGPFSTTWHDEFTRDQAGQEWLERVSLPVPRWWPSGLGYSINQGDPRPALSASISRCPDMRPWPGGREAAPPHGIGRSVPTAAMCTSGATTLGSGLSPSTRHCRPRSWLG